MWIIRPIFRELGFQEIIELAQGALTFEAAR